MIVISDATALIHLSMMGRLDLLRDLFGQIHIAGEVYDEVVVRGAGQPGADEVRAAPWIHAMPRTSAQDFIDLCSVLGMGDGEAASIVLATAMNADLLILDDRPARMEAEGRGLVVTGTVGVLLDAARFYQFDFEQLLNDLCATGFHLSGRDYQRALLRWNNPPPP